jgi:SHS2 domain-containing protein
MFEVLEHTADIGFRATAKDLPELFETAAEALVAHGDGNRQHRTA